VSVVKKIGALFSWPFGVPDPPQMSRRQPSVP